MPNHFHFLVHVKEANPTPLNSSIGVMLRSYTRAINIQEGQTGSLFQSSTKAKEVEEPLVCFNYIHLNPLRAGLVKDLNHWNYSSFNHQCGLIRNDLINDKLVRELLGIDLDNYEKEIFKYLPYWDFYHGKFNT